MQHMFKLLKIGWKSVMGGIAISCGAMIYLTLENHIVGALLFSIGLFTIYTFDFSLFTGKVCYLPEKSPLFAGELLVVYAGNAVGTVVMGYLLPLTKLRGLADKAAQLSAVKLSDTLFSTFVMAVLCGLMMCIAVKGYTTIQNGTGKYLALILPVMVFILAGFEHSIADLFYFSLANAWDDKAVLYSAVIAAGNALGGVLIPLSRQITDGFSESAAEEA